MSSLPSPTCTILKKTSSTNYHKQKEMINLRLGENICKEDFLKTGCYYTGQAGLQLAISSGWFKNHSPFALPS
jgi:hypothetical protein